MKNILSKIAVFAALALACLPAKAQRGFDLFGLPRMITIQAPVQLTNNATPGIAGSFPLTNQPIDVHAFTGVAWLHLNVMTNATVTNANTGQIVTNLIQTGPDLTNWFTMTNVAIVTSNTSFTQTNVYYGGTNLLATNSYLLPGTNFYPNPAVYGWQTPTFYPFPFTNSGASFALAGAQDYLIGFNVDDQSRYIRLIWTTGGQAFTNVVVNAQFFGTPHGN